MRPFIWWGSAAESWLIRAGRDIPVVVGEFTGYATLGAAMDAAIASLSGEPTA